MRQQIVLASQSPDPSLLIFAIPAEIALGGFEISAFVTPLDARRGGLLLALPAGLLAEDVLSPPGGFLDEALVGPSQEFEVDMFEEDERGAVASAGFKNTVLVADFSNSVLQFLREYDPVTDSLVDVIPFVDSNPSPPCLAPKSFLPKPWPGLPKRASSVSIFTVLEKSRLQRLDNQPSRKHQPSASPQHASQSKCRP